MGFAQDTADDAAGAPSDTCPGGARPCSCSASKAELVLITAGCSWAGLRLAEALSARGKRVVLFDQRPPLRALSDGVVWCQVGPGGAGWGRGGAPD